MGMKEEIKRWVQLFVVLICGHIFEINRAHMAIFHDWLTLEGAMRLLLAMGAAACILLVLEWASKDAVKKYEEKQKNGRGKERTAL